VQIDGRRSHGSLICTLETFQTQCPNPTANSKPSRGQTALSTGELTDPAILVFSCLCPGCCSCCRSCRNRARWRWLLETSKHIYFLGSASDVVESRVLRASTATSGACLDVRYLAVSAPSGGQTDAVSIVHFGSGSGYLEYCAVISPCHEASGTSGTAADRALNVCRAFCTI
jgi:hypothetical protein